AVTRCERCASYAATTPKTPTSSFPSAADQSVLLASTASSSALARLRAPASGRRQARDDFRFPLNHLGIRRVALGNQLLDELDRALDLLGRHVLDHIAMLDLVFAGHQQSEDLEIGRRLRPAHLRNRLLPMLGEIPQQRANQRLA